MPAGLLLPAVAPGRRLRVHPAADAELKVAFSRLMLLFRWSAAG
jgi:hypothetical protein